MSYLTTSGHPDLVASDLAPYGASTDLHATLLGGGATADLHPTALIGGGVGGASDIHSAILHHGNAGIDLNLSGGLSDDLLRHQADLSGMYSGYGAASTSHAKNALSHYHQKVNQFGDGVTGTTLAAAAALHNGGGLISNMEMGQREEALSTSYNKLDHQYYSDDPFYNNNSSAYEHQQLNTLNNRLSRSNHRIHHPSAIHPALSQVDLLSSRELNNKSDSWLLGEERYYRDTDYRGATGSQQRRRGDFDYTNSPQAPLTTRTQQQQQQRPSSAPLHTHRTTQQQQHHPSSYNASASMSNAYQSNVRHATVHYRNALNFNAHNNYSSGGPGGPPVLPHDPAPVQQSASSGFGISGFLGGKIMGGGNQQQQQQQQPGNFMGMTGEEEVRQQSVSSESQAYYGNETMIKELRPEFVRWFYRYEQDRKWRPFTGYDSIRIESKYREVFRGQLASYSHSAYYPVASSNDESTDFSKFVYQLDTHAQQMVINANAQGFGASSSSRYMPGSSLWPGRAPDTTVDAEFNHGGPGFPSQVRNNSVGASLFGRMGNGNQIHREKILHKANSASALLGGPGANNGMTSINPNHPPDLTKCIVVREGLYEVDLGSWTCFSTYWPGDTCLITRGTWFYDGTWDPLPEDQAEKLEEAHMSKFCGAALLNPHQNHNQQSESDAQKSATPLHRVSFNDFHVDWTSPTDIFWYSTATSHKLMRSVGQKLGFSNMGHRVCRGYYKPALIQDRPSEISHIVFVIHGIGQKMDTGRIVRNCSADCVASMKEKYFPQLNNAKHRAEFFPVEWRSAAKLDNDIVEAITPQKLLTLRQLLNSTAMDIMYYTSPLYRAEIQNALIDELNRIYANFVKRNPNFVMNGGKVSVMAHSLGAVITYDIITGYLCGSVEDEISLMQQQLLHMPRRALPQQQQGLLFTLEHFFCLGSPLSVFLALRWREPHDPALRSQVLPHHLCRRLYNIFYSSDPVAYRMEPLLHRVYAKIAPVTIHAYNAPTKPRYSDMPRERITIVTKTASDNTNSNTATSTLPGPFADPTTTTTTTTAPPHKTLPSIPNIPRPNLIPSGIKLPMPPSPNKAGPDSGQNNWGGWLGGNIMKIWKGSTSPAAGLLEQTGLTGGGAAAAGGNHPTHDTMGQGGQHHQHPSHHPHNNPHNNPHHHHAAAGDLNHPLGVHPSDEANFFAQQSKENYSTVVDEELSNIPNDLEYRIDYVLRESQFSGTSYIAALTSHTSYWNSPDAAYFVMTHLYDDLIEQSQGYAAPGER